MTHSSFKKKQLKDQVIVITGASNGIGLVTSKKAAASGAKVVLAGDKKEDLHLIVQEIVSTGGKAIGLTTDVTQIKDLIKLRDKAIERFGGIDSWINNASTSIYGYLIDGNIADEKRLFDINFWGTRIASNIAVHAMKKNGGVLINTGCEISLASQPFLGMYSSSKQALKTFTDALRSELRDLDLPVEVCLLRPTTVDPEDHHLDSAANAILKCVENPERDVYVGGPARLSAILDTFFPKVKDMMTESQMKELKIIKDNFIKHENH